MLDWLDFGGWLLDHVVQLLVSAVNGLISALAVVLGALFSVLPDMPALPDLPESMETAEAWVAWFFPVGTVVQVLAFIFAMWLLWQAVALGLRWAKALND